MALNFSKMNFSVSFNPTSAFPLDARSYFESYNLALAAAAKAVEAGSAEGTLYFGQTIAVVENGAAQLYIIQPDKTLTEVGSKVVVDENAFELDADGTLKLLGLADAEEGAQLVKGADGKLSWIVPSTETVEGLQTTVATLQQDIKNIKDTLNPVDEDGNPVEGGLVSDVADLEEAIGEEAVYDEEGNLITPATGIYKDIADIEDKIGDPANSELDKEATGLYAELELKANAADVYTKEETEDAIATAIAGADHLKRIIVDSVLDINVDEDSSLYYIYMVPTGLEEDDDKYDEYMVIEYVNADDQTVRKIEKVGSWEIDLSQYAKVSDLTSLSNTVADNKLAAENAIAAEKERAEAAEKANTDAIAAEKERAEAAEKANADAITEINETKVNKTDVYLKNEVYTKGEADQAIADKISEVNGGESAGEVLGQLNAYKTTVNMEVWGNETGAGDENGNSRIDNLETEVTALKNAKPFISNVSDDFQVIDGTLNLKELSVSKIEGLQDMSDNLTVVQKQVGSLEDILNGYVNEETQEQVPGLVAEVQAIKTDYLTLVDFNAAVGNLEALLAANTTIVGRLETIEEVLKWQEMSGV